MIGFKLGDAFGNRPGQRTELVDNGFAAFVNALEQRPQVLGAVLGSG